MNKLSTSAKGSVEISSSLLPKFVAKIPLGSSIITEEMCDDCVDTLDSFSCKKYENRTYGL